MMVLDKRIYRYLMKRINQSIDGFERTKIDRMKRKEEK
jgi:hypothetical protein